MTQVAVGSTVLIHVPGSRSTEGQPVDIPAVVLAQDPEDGVLTLFAMHFEGQFMQRRKPEEVTVLLDAGQQGTNAVIVGLIDAALVGLRDETRNEIETIQRQFAEFQEQMLELITGMVGSAVSSGATGVTGPVGPDEDDKPFETDKFDEATKTTLESIHHSEPPESGVVMKNAGPRRR